MAAAAASAVSLCFCLILYILLAQSTDRHQTKPVFVCWGHAVYIVHANSHRRPRSHFCVFAGESWKIHHYLYKDCIDLFVWERSNVGTRLHLWKEVVDLNTTAESIDSSFRFSFELSRAPVSGHSSSRQTSAPPTTIVTHICLLVNVTVQWVRIRAKI